MQRLRLNIQVHLKIEKLELGNEVERGLSFPCLLEVSPFFVIYFVRIKIKR